MFFKRRSRANSYIDNDAPARSQSYDDYEKRPDSSRDRESIKHQQQVVEPQANEEDMYPRQQQQQQPQEALQYARGANGGMPSAAMGQPMGAGGLGGLGGMPAMAQGKPEPMPDLLAAAFNQAVRPYTEKIEQLESQMADMQAWIEQLEQQRAEVHGWIDKRGLRPGMFSPPDAMLRVALKLM
jgi:hypothetical protein